jgi:hypothetical protein
MPASRANGTGRISSSIPMQQLSANSTSSQAASNPPPSSPLPPIASSTSPQTQLPSSALVLVPPPSTAVPPALSRSPSPAPTSSSTTPTIPPSASWGVVRSNYKTVLGALGACITIALTSAGIYLTDLYGKITLKYTRWTLNNDFRDGCINDREHNLPLAEECFAEFARPRVSAMTQKSKSIQFGTSTEAIGTVLLLLIFQCITLYLNRPKPVESPAKTDRPNKQPSEPNPKTAKPSIHKQYHIPPVRKPRQLATS